MSESTTTPSSGNGSNGDPAAGKMLDKGKADLAAGVAAVKLDEAHEEIFEDSFEDPSIVSHPNDLEQSFIDCERAIKMFFNNDIDSAMKIMKPWSQTSLYHSLGVAIFEFIPAVLTFDPVQIRAALAAINISIDICDKTRRQYTLAQSIGSIIKKPYSKYSDLEAHAELCYAEALLLLAAMTVLEGEDLTGLLKGILKVRTCHSTYKSCVEINAAKCWDSPQSKIHFESGVRLGNATFNLMVSVLPRKITSILEIVGFGGDKAYGLSELVKGSQEAGLRSVLCDMTLLVYHLLLCPFAGGRADLPAAAALLDKSLKEFPESVWFLAFKARYEFLQGNIPDAEQIYESAITINGNGHSSMLQFRLLCYWELMWMKGLTLKFNESASLAERLLTESKFSKTTHTYIRAAMLIQARPRAGEGDTENDPLIRDLIRQAPAYKLRIAGKSLPMEKFAVMRCARYRAQENRLTLPGLELMCIWNLFPVLASNKQALHNILAIIDRTREEYEKTPQEWMGIFAPDNMALLFYMSGCAKAALALPLLAIQDFQKVISMKSELKEDIFLVPFSACEMATCHYDLGEVDEALVLLKQSRKKYSGYYLESRLQFRVQARLDMVREHRPQSNS